MLDILLIVTTGLLLLLLWKSAEHDLGLELVGILLFLTVLGACLECEAKGKPLDVDEVSVSAAKFGCNREPMTPQYDCHDYVGRVSSVFNLRILNSGYWNNNIHTEGLEGQVKTVGWHFELGIRLTPYLNTFYEHHSRHVMEGDQPLYYDPKLDEIRRGKFPVEDSYGVRLRFYTNPTPAGSLIGK